MQRLNHLTNQLSMNPTGLSAITAKHPDDVVITAAYRTPITRAGKGGFRDMESSELLLELFKGVLARTKLDPSLVEDIVIGNVLNRGAGANEHRAAALGAGIPYSVPFEAVNRQCSSGLMAVNSVANKITAGQIDVGIAGGVESMSSNYGPQAAPSLPDVLAEHAEAAKCLVPMGITSENVAAKYNVSRQDQDAFAARSYQKAEKAQATGLFDEEIIPIKAHYLDSDDKEQTTTVSKDDGVRKGVTKESLAKIKPAFQADGVTHAGNASQVSDGAGMVVLMRRSVAEKLKQPILAKFVDCVVVGVPPDLMGIGPGVAIPKLLKHNGLTNQDVDVFEINEAFASQVLQSLRAADIPEDKVNPKGGAIALGHPLGATGARQIATLLAELKRSNKTVGVTSMCIGSGMGAAGLIVRE